MESWQVEVLESGFPRNRLYGAGCPFHLVWDGAWLLPPTKQLEAEINPLYVLTIL